MTFVCEPGQQVAVLPIHCVERGGFPVLMVISRDAVRRAMPKGWPMDGKKPGRAALSEALEVAGTVDFVSSDTMGVYHYRRDLGCGEDIQCRVTANPVLAEKPKQRCKDERNASPIGSVGNRPRTTWTSRNWRPCR